MLAFFGAVSLCGMQLCLGYGLCFHHVLMLLLVCATDVVCWWLLKGRLNLPQGFGSFLGRVNPYMVCCVVAAEQGADAAA